MSAYDQDPEIPPAIASDLPSTETAKALMLPLRLQFITAPTNVVLIVPLP
jgi:hypothetical protein